MRKKTNYFLTVFLNGDSIFVRSDDNRTRKQHQIYCDGGRYFTLSNEFDSTGRIVTNPVNFPPSDIEEKK